MKSVDKLLDIQIDRWGMDDDLKFLWNNLIIVLIFSIVNS